MEKLNHSQALAVCHHIQSANYGSFASALSCTYILADQDNREKLLNAFSELFIRINGDREAYEAFNSKVTA
jgi:hypothetical protein